MYKHIMFPSDGSGMSLQALNQATAFAKAIGAQLTLIHVVSPFHLHVRSWATPQNVITKIEEEHIAESRKTAEAMLAELEQRTKAAGVRCDSAVVVGDAPYREIIKAAADNGCDLIVMASHGRSGIDALLLGSETTKVLTHSKVPVLVMR